MARESKADESSARNDEKPFDLLWTRPERGERGRQPGYSRDLIAEAAVRIADIEGIDAVSMRRVAAAIGTRATSLYRYVQSKDELLDLMIDRVAGEPGLPTLSGKWRADLRLIAHHMRDMVNRHSWMIAIPVFRSALGPKSLALFEATLKALDGHGLTLDDMLVIATALATFTRGYAASEIAEHEAETRSQLNREQWMLAQAHYVGVIQRSGDFPMLAKLIDQADLPHDPEFIEQGFQQSLDYWLDGIALRIGAVPDRPAHNTN